MAIGNFKKIEDRKAYLVEDTDRQIFEKEIGKSYFGKGFADMIEFVLYDSNDNPLPQGDSGRLVRYININDEESKKYFLVSQNEFTKKSNNAPEMLFDLEQLIRDAGYNAGIFKTQITLLNRRVGKEEVDNDKLWIHEISPSRTEVRLLPVKNNNPSQDLLTRYDVFTKNGQFRDDTIYYIDEYIQSIDIERVFQKFLTSKGRVSEGQQYISLIKKEFKVESVEQLITIVRDKFIESMKNFANGREYRITSNTYGQPKQNFDNIELSISYIKRTASEILTEIINYYLPKRNILEKDILTQDQQVTFDKVKQILKTVGSNSRYDSTIPDEVNAQVRGCTDPDAINYNPSAEIDNGTCEYKQEDAPPQIRRGCTDVNALNYDEYATEDDGNCQYEIVKPIEIVTGGGDGDVDIEIEPVICRDPKASNYNQEGVCVYPPPPQRCTDSKATNFGQVGKCKYPPKPKPTITKTWYVWSATADIKFKNQDKFIQQSYVEYNSFTITYNEDSLVSTGDIREVPKPRPPQIITRKYYVRNISHELYFQSKSFNANGYDSYSNDPRDKGRPMQFRYVDKSGAEKISSTIEPGEDIAICAKQGSIVPMEGLKIIEQGVCGTDYPPPPVNILGCTDADARNYNPSATINDGTCQYLGCTDPTAINYWPKATTDNGTCRYAQSGGVGSGGGGGTGGGNKKEDNIGNPTGGGTSDGRTDPRGGTVGGGTGGSFRDERNDRNDRNMR